MQLTPTQRRILREETARVGNNVPVYVEPAPKKKDGELARWTCYGERGGWHTKGGARILYPSAYSKSGWSNMVYQTDDRVLVVQADFALKLLKPSVWANVSENSPYNQD